MPKKLKHSWISSFRRVWQRHANKGRKRGAKWSQSWDRTSSSKKTRKSCWVRFARERSRWRSSPIRMLYRAARATTTSWARAVSSAQASPRWRIAMSPSIARAIFATSTKKKMSYHRNTLTVWTTHTSKSITKASSASKTSTRSPRITR